MFFVVRNLIYFGNKKGVKRGSQSMQIAYEMRRSQSWDQLTLKKVLILHIRA